MQQMGSVDVTEWLCSVTMQVREQLWVNSVLQLPVACGSKLQLQSNHACWNSQNNFYHNLTPLLTLPRCSTDMQPNPPSVTSAPLPG